VNHDCDPNAGHYEDETFDVKILFAERDIEPGEEITISYTFLQRREPSMRRELLENTWGIVCDVDCFCRNPEILAMVEEYRGLYWDIDFLLASRNVSDAMRNVRRRLQMLDAIHASLTDRLHAFNEGFQAGIMNRETLEEAKNYARCAYKIKAAIIHPDSEELMEMKRYADDPSSHSNYLLGEKGM